MVVLEQSSHVYEVNTGNVINDELLTWDLHILSQNIYTVNRKECNENLIDCLIITQIIALETLK